MICILRSHVLDCFFFFSSRRRHTRLQGDWSSDVCSSDLVFFHDCGAIRCIGSGPVASSGTAGPRNCRKPPRQVDRKSTRLNSSHLVISYAVFCLKKKNSTTSQYILNNTAQNSSITLMRDD